MTAAETGPAPPEKMLPLQLLTIAHNLMIDQTLTVVPAGRFGEGAAW
jgi:hypothetical protein